MVARPIASLAVLALALAACGGRAVAPASGPSIASPPPTETASATPTERLSPTGPPPPSEKPVALPPGVPASYGPDDEPGNVPLEALVPKNAAVTGTWFASGDGLDAILVAYAQGADPLAQAHGLVEWNRFGAKPHWRATYGFWDRVKAGVFGITTQTGDATGDGSPDALTFESTGGSGACGTWRVIDLAASREIWDQQTCDATVAFSTHPVGLTLTQAVFKPGDSHCCPSAQRISQLEYDGTTFRATSKKVTPAG